MPYSKVTRTYTAVDHHAPRAATTYNIVKTILVEEDTPEFWDEHFRGLEAALGLPLQLTRIEYGN